MYGVLGGIKWIASAWCDWRFVKQLQTVALLWDTSQWVWCQSHMGKMWFQEEQSGHFWPSAWRGTHLAEQNPKCRMQKITDSSISSNLLWTTICSVEIHLTIWPQHSPSQIRQYEGKIQTLSLTHTHIQIYHNKFTVISWIPPKFKFVYVSMWLKLLPRSISSLCCVYVGMLCVDKSGHPRCTTTESRSNTCPPPSHNRNQHHPGRTHHNRCVELSLNKPNYSGKTHQQHSSSIVG